MKTVKAITLINVVSQLGVCKTARGLGWQSRAETVRSYLETAGFVVAGIITVDEPTTVDEGQAALRRLDAVSSVCERVRHAVSDSLQHNVFPVCLGGDHSLSIGSVSATAQWLAEKNETLGVLWTDAHLDMNTPDTTPSGNIHGMALAALCGLGHPRLANLGRTGPQVQRSHVAAVGTRFTDRAELENLANEGPRVASMRAIDRIGIDAAMKEILPVIVSDTGGFHLSLDLDVIDPSETPGVNTPFPGGMTFREARQVCDIAAATGRMISMDVVEHNPEAGHEERMLPVMAELLACALGASMMP